MAEMIDLEAEDGHKLTAYRADPDGPARGGLVVIQEIFGVNSHIRDVCDRFAASGYSAIAPAVFDRLQKGIELEYTEQGVAAGRDLIEQLGWDDALKDIWAAALALDPNGKAGVVGYCWGGSVAWLAACRLNIAAAVGYYGRQIPEFVDEKPGVPVMLHFGENDPLIPLEGVETVRAAHPQVPIFTYPAGHGFTCDQRADFHAESSRRALVHTMDFFAENLT